MAICFILYTLLSILFAVSLSLSLSVINSRKSRKRAVGFFHPYTNDGGGGERVLWCAVKAIQEETPDLDCVIFTGDHDSSSSSLALRAVDRFGVHIHFPPKVIYLNKRKWIEERTYPQFHNDSNLLSTCKLVYYRAFSWIYGIVGSCTHLAMVNSSWTKSHIEVLWKIPERITRVYPPCDTS